ncbi:MAG: hypothetical protein FWG14_09085 [Peptococcaceae bacterium]|nr:hypothetical protein [Peptococcaceae bacterium]
MPSRVPRPSSSRLRRRFSPDPAGIKKIFTRLTILIAIALVLVQIGLAGDPIQMYLQTVGDAASLAMDFSGGSIPVGGQGIDMRGETLEASSESPLPVEAQNQQSGQVFLRPVPAQEGIRIWQDNTYLGEIPPLGKTFSVKPGRVTLEAPNLDTGNNRAQKISVEIFYLGQKYAVSLSEGKAFFDVNR